MLPGCLYCGHYILDVGWHELGKNEKVWRIMDSTCCDEAVARAVESLWKKCSVADAPIPHQTSLLFIHCTFVMNNTVLHGAGWP